ncbi:MAG: hypothetical protein ABSE73_13230 [Planctomycetota bacterium]
MARMPSPSVLLALVVLLGCGSPSQPVQAPPPAHPATAAPTADAAKKPEDSLAVNPPRLPEAQAQPAQDTPAAEVKPPLPPEAPQAPLQAFDQANEKRNVAIPADIEKLMVKARTVGAAIQDPGGFWQRNRELAQAAKALSQRDATWVFVFGEKVSRGQIDMFTPGTFATARKLRDDGVTDTPIVKLLEKFFPFLIADTESEFGLDVIAQRRVKALAVAIINGQTPKLTIQGLLALPGGEQRYILTYHPYMVEYPAVKLPHPPEAKAQPGQDAPAPPVPIAPAQSAPVVSADVETGYTTATGKPIYGAPGDYYYYSSRGKRVAWTLPLDPTQRSAAAGQAQDVGPTITRKELIETNAREVDEAIKEQKAAMSHMSGRNYNAAVANLEQLKKEKRSKKIPSFDLDFGKPGLIAGIKIVQVLDKSHALAAFWDGIPGDRNGEGLGPVLPGGERMIGGDEHMKTACLSGISTTGMVDGAFHHFHEEVIVARTGTYRYTTVLGASRTVPLVERFTVKE